MSDSTAAAQDRLDFIWDAINQGQVLPSSEQDLGLQGDIEALKALDRLPDPDPAFLINLRARLAGSPVTKASGSMSHRRELGLVAPFPRLDERRTLIRWTIAVIAAALIIAALSTGSGWLPGSDNAPMVASAMASYTPIHLTPTQTPLARHSSPRIGAPLDERDAATAPIESARLRDIDSFVTLVIQVTRPDE